MIVINQSKGTVLADNCRRADNFFSRFMGLMGVTDLRRGQGLLITPCNSIHMFFMKIPLDIVFLDKNNKVVHTLENMKPWSVSKIIFNAHSALELPVNTIRATATSIGDNLTLKYTQI